MRAVDSKRATAIKRWVRASGAMGFAAGCAFTALILLIKDPFEMPLREFYSLTQTFLVLSVVMTLAFRLLMNQARKESDLEGQYIRNPMTESLAEAEETGKRAAVMAAPERQSAASKRLSEAKVPNRN